MVDVALHQDNGPVLRNDIAERQELSADYIEQLFVKLRKADLVESVRGPGGGYRLARGADQITAGDIIRAAEGPIALVQCVDPRSKSPCHRADLCVTRQLWKSLSIKVADVLDSVTLEDLRDQARALEAAFDRGSNPLEQ
jgi:Rrf2 family protein